MSAGLTVRNARGNKVFSSEVTPYRLIGNVDDFMDDPRISTWGREGLTSSALAAVRIPAGAALQWELIMRGDERFPASFWVPGTGSVQVPAHHNFAIIGYRRSTDPPPSYYIYDRLPPDRLDSGFGIQVSNAEGVAALNSSVKQMTITEIVSVDVVVINSETPKSYIGTFPKSLLIVNNMYSDPQEHPDDLDARVLIERIGDSYSAYMRTGGNLDPAVQLNGTYRIDCIVIPDHEG